MDLVREEEDANKLQFGPEFDQAGMLSTSEVAYLFQQRQAKGDATTFTPVFNATLTYTQTFSKLKSKAAIQESRKVLMDHKALSPFERAQLINLSPVTVAEAKHLIPSLGDLDDDEDPENRLTDLDLQDLLDELKRLRSYT
eukprot:TRINITY_DN4443_c0_g1_i1.p1 TRINITY_DN4443_c0_g1~~TRINITY_DN4443_c0_g1_i1.p1  ORF type:complete len:141 (+),score=41.24 TRINITY_DN4443_c0_g1_i1:43-465(+)